MKKILKKFYEFLFYNPICKHPVGTKKNYLDLFSKIKFLSYEKIKSYENRLNFKINKEFFDNLALKTQISIKKSDNNYQHGRILYSTLSNYIQHKKNEFFIIVEIGTARGFSSLCMSKALNDQNRKGNILTCDIIKNKRKIFWNCILDCDNKKKTREELLLEWKNLTTNISFIDGDYRKLKKLNINRIHFAFIDAQHEYKNVKEEFDFISSKQIKNDIIIFDDIHDKFPGVKLMIDKIENSNFYSVERIFSSSERGYAICNKN